MIHGEISTGRAGVWILSLLISPVFVTTSQLGAGASPLSRLIPRHSEVEKRAGAPHIFFFPSATLALDEKEATGQKGDIGPKEGGKVQARKTRLDRQEPGARSQEQGARCDIDSNSHRVQYDSFYAVVAS